MGLAFIIIFVFLAAFSLIKIQLDLKENILTEHTSIKWEYAFWCSFFILLILRLIIAAFCQGFSSDLACWAAWGERVNRTGTAGFYSPDFFCDYPPFYIYILGILNHISSLFNIGTYGVDFLNKLPAVFCDMFIMAAIYSTAKSSFDNKKAFFISVIFGICPVFWYDSAVWGQIESVLLLFLFLSFLELYKGNYVAAILLYVTAVLIKPQGLLLAPVYLLSLLSTRDIKTILVSAFSGLALMLVLSMPFSPAWQESNGFWGFINSFNPIWLIEKYMTTLSSYSYFTVNAFNLYGLLGLNWVSLESNRAILSVINIVIIGLSVAGAVFIYLKAKSLSSKLFLSAYFLLGFIYTFGFKMHERYIILPIFFLLAEYLFSKNKRILWLFAGLSSVAFLNIFYILNLTFSGNDMAAYNLVAPISFAEVLLFVISNYIIFTDYILNKEYKSLSFKMPSKLTAVLKGCNDNGYMHIKSGKMTRLDALLLTVIVCVYSVFAYVNLGDTKAPQTYYKPETGDEFVITLESDNTISAIPYYSGIGDVGSNPGITLSYSQDGKNWTQLSEPCFVLKSVFKWEVKNFEPFNARYFKCIPDSTDYTLYEIGFITPTGQRVNIESVTGVTGADYNALADEQDLVTTAPSYMNGTYFDEIYHPRTAYEHLNLMPYYETTHPPLGKLMMSLGIAAFGMTPFGWRCIGTLIGILMLPVLYLFLKKMFNRTRYACIGTLLFAFDFMHFSLTRIGTIDSYPVFFIICMYYFMYCFYKSSLDLINGLGISLRRPLLFLLLSGLSMGLGCASKWTAVYASAGLGIEFFIIMFWLYKASQDRIDFCFKKFFVKTCLWCLLFFIVIPAAIYTLSYLPISMVDGYGNVFEAMLKNQEYMFKYHSGLNDTHPYSSPWYSWPFVYKPMWAYQAPETTVAQNQIGCISIFQNPFLSWLGIVAFFYSLIIGFKNKDKTVLFLLIGLLAQYLPWALVSRYALQYHFFASMPFVVCFVIYAVKDIEKRLPSFGYVSSAVTALCLIMFICFYPVISGVPVSRFWAETILTWFSSWVFFI